MMKLYLDSRNQLVCNGFKTFAQDVFNDLLVEWYTDIPNIRVNELETNHLVVYCYTDNLEELRENLQSQLVPKEVIKVVFIVRGTLNGLSELVSYGVTGFFSLSCSERECKQAFEKILHNQNYYCKELWEMIIGGGNTTTFSTDLKHKLTNREFEVIEKLVDGFSTQEISHQLGLSVHTVQTHRKNSFKKLNVRSLSDLLLLKMKY